MWKAQVSALSDVRHCIAIDYEPGRLDIFRLVHDLGHDRADLVGHSWGGHEVLAVWRRHPSLVRTIALFGVMFSTDARHRRRVAKVLAIEATDGQIDEADLAREAAGRVATAEHAVTRAAP